MAYFARIANNVVVEIVVYDLTLEQVQNRYHASLTWVEADASVREGMTYSGGSFSTPSQAQTAGGDVSPEIGT